MKKQLTFIFSVDIFFKSISSVSSWLTYRYGLYEEWILVVNVRTTMKGTRCVHHRPSESNLTNLGISNTLHCPFLLVQFHFNYNIQFKWWRSSLCLFHCKMCFHFLMKSAKKIVSHTFWFKIALHYFRSE